MDPRSETGSEKRGPDRHGIKARLGIAGLSHRAPHIFEENDLNPSAQRWVIRIFRRRGPNTRVVVQELEFETREALDAQIVRNELDRNESGSFNSIIIENEAGERIVIPQLEFSGYERRRTA